jgi:hypothetical protein
MAFREVLGVYKDLDSAVAATDALADANFTREDFDVLTNAPYPEGAFGEEPGRHRLFMFPLIGAASGFSVGLLITAGTQLAYPLVTYGMPLLSIPPMIVIMYEGTMLGALIFTVIGVLFESRLPRLRLGVYDTRITAGSIGILARVPEDRLDAAADALRSVEHENIVLEDDDGKIISDGEPRGAQA